MGCSVRFVTGCMYYAISHVGCPIFADKPVLFGTDAVLNRIRVQRLRSDGGGK